MANPSRLTPRPGCKRMIVFMLDRVMNRVRMSVISIPPVLRSDVIVRNPGMGPPRMRIPVSISKTRGDDPTYQRPAEPMIKSCTRKSNCCIRNRPQTYANFSVQVPIDGCMTILLLAVLGTVFPTITNLPLILIDTILRFRMAMCPPFTRFGTPPFPKIPFGDRPRLAELTV